MPASPIGNTAVTRADAIGKATHATFFDAVNKRCVIDEPIYHAFPLLAGITPELERKAVLEKTAWSIQLHSGMFGESMSRPHFHRSEHGRSRR